MPKTPEQIAREAIDRRLIDAGWVIQDMDKINLSVALGVAIREFPTSTGPETLRDWIAAPDTVRNNLKHLPELDTTGFRKCQEIAIKNLDTSFAENRPKTLVQMATGAGKTFTATTESYRLLTYGKMNRILFLVDTKSLGVQAEQEFRAYVPNGEQRVFSDIFGVRLLKKSVMSPSNQVYISTI